MLFVVSYRKKHASSKTRKSFFAEYNEQPSVEQVQALVNSTSGGNFAEKTIAFLFFFFFFSGGDFAEKTTAFQKCPGFDTDELIAAGITVFRFESEAQIGGPGTGLESPTADSKYDET